MAFSSTQMSTMKSSRKAPAALKALRKEFPDIAPDVVALMFESSNGDAMQARAYLQEMQVDLLRQKLATTDQADSGSQLSEAIPTAVDHPATPQVDTTLSASASQTGQKGCSLSGGSMVPTENDSVLAWQCGSQLANAARVHLGSLSHRPDGDPNDTQSSCPTDDDSGTADHIIQPVSQPEAAVDFLQSWKASREGFEGGGAAQEWAHDQRQETADLWESNGLFPMQLTLDKELACQLIMSFGLMQVPINVNHREDLKVDLDRCAAYALYLAWKSTQEKYILPTTSDEQFQDSKLAEALQELEHETYAEGTLKQTAFSQIMDETYALNLLGKESEARGMQMNSALKYQTESNLESKWVDVLLKAHNVDDDSALPHSSGNVRNVYASNLPKPVVGLPDEGGRSRLTVEADTFVPAAMQLNVKPVNFPGTGLPSGRTNKEVDYYGHRQEALELQRKAVQLGARAGASYRDKKLGGGAAAYYLQKSHETRAMAKDAHVAASLDILSTQNLNASDGEVDLHGLRADEVSYALDLFFQRKHNKKELKIISGVGRHSKNGAGTSEVRRQVAAYLKRHAFPYEEGPPDGVFYVQKWQKLMARPP
ncbi:hypothetical protein RvY_12369 [Ramazzottius varieornatus]|uniref:Smr domain-containing protein n=1 Tax=Ramazzottius varieornatus TaxID=947166 RepID=A0A1D1VT11_RAMVA|nr:hypothetical protein RvY_12369 [Ramazzottius varieornatus]